MSEEEEEEEEEEHLDCNGDVQRSFKLRLKVASVENRRLEVTIKINN